MRIFPRLLIAAFAIAAIAAFITPDPRDQRITPPADPTFTASPDPVQRGGAVTLRWHVPEAETVVIQQRYGSYKNAPDRQFDALPAEGELTIDLSALPRSDTPGSDLPYIHTVSFWLMTPGEPSSAFTPGLTFIDSLDVSIHCPYDKFFFGVDPYYAFCPLADSAAVTAVYQPFENGFLLWREDTGTVYVFRAAEESTFGSALAFPSDPGIPPTSAGDPVFDPVLRSGHGITIGIGAPTARAVTYNMTVQDTYHDSRASAVAYLTLPDSRVIRYLEDLYASGWHCLTCES